MTVRILIVWHPGPLYQACVFSRGFERMWEKLYPSKEECMRHLCDIDLLTAQEAADGIVSDFDSRDGSLSADAETDIGLLEAAGFIENMAKRMN